MYAFALSKFSLFKSIQIICLASFFFFPLSLHSSNFIFIFWCLNINLFLSYNFFLSFSRFLSFSLSFSVHGPFNSNMPARSPFSRPRRIYPVHVPIVKRPTIRDITNSAVKKIPFYMEKFSEPLHPSDKIMFSVYKKKRRIFQRSN